MALFTLKPVAGTDDASQRVINHNNFESAAAYAPVRVIGGSYTTERQAAIRFSGPAFPVGTDAVKFAKVFLYQSTSSASEVDFNCDVYIEVKTTADPDGIEQSPLPFQWTATDDIVGRVKSTAKVEWVVPVFDRYQQNTSPDLRPLFRELMECAGAEFNDPDDPYKATTPTKHDISNPTLIFVPKGTCCARIHTVDSAIVANPTVGDMKKVPALQLASTDDTNVIVGPDNRTHVAIISDSIGWSLMGDGETIANTKVSYFNFGSGGDLNTTGLFSLDDVPRGMCTVQQNGQWYTLDDSSGSQGYGALRPEGRKGFTEHGLLMDAIMARFGVTTSECVIHNYGLGGTTIWDGHLSSGVYSYADHNPAVNRLDEISVADVLAELQDLSSDNTILTNPLWTYVDKSGYSLPSLLIDTNVKKIIILYLGGGNDFFNVQDSGGRLLPVSRDQGNWNIVKQNLTRGYKAVVNFCNDLRNEAGGEPIEFMICGYPNFMTDDPRIPEISVNLGPPPGGYHNKINAPFTSVGVDDYYGGNDSGFMSPFGGPNPIPKVPFYLNILGIPVFSAPQECDLPGYTIRPGPRAIDKQDAGFFKQFKAGGKCIATFNYDDTQYFRWYSHYAADHYGYKIGAGTDAQMWSNMETYSKENDMVNFLNTFNGAPYRAGSRNLTNMRWLYSSVNVTNETINGGLHEVVGGAATTAIADLQANGVTCAYIEMWDSLGDEVGNGVTASGGLDCFIDGVHPTSYGSTLYANALLDRILDQSASSYLWHLQNSGKFGLSRMMPVVMDGII